MSEKSIIYSKNYRNNSHSQQKNQHGESTFQKSYSERNLGFNPNNFSSSGIRNDGYFF